MTKPRVLIVGLGLIGGSFAKAVREAGVCTEVLGVSRRLETATEAVARGVIDRGFTSIADAVAEMTAGDVVMITTPTLSVRQTLEQLIEAEQKGLIITDGASVKGSIANDALAVFGFLPARFVPGHPIAGSEKSGLDAVNSRLYQKHEVILTPAANTCPEAIHTVQALWQACGAEVSVMSATEHDEVLALTSHLPHMLAFNLVDTLAARSENNEIFRYAAGGFKDFTRIAASDPTMWHDIALANREALLSGLTDYEQHLQQLRRAIETGDSDYLLTMFSRAKRAREYFGELYAKRQTPAS